MIESESEYENGNAGEEHVNERDGQPSEDEAEIVGDGAVLDARLKKLFASAEEEAMKVYDTTHVCGESSSDSENEEENVTGVCEYLYDRSFPGRKAGVGAHRCGVERFCP